MIDGRKNEFPGWYNTTRCSSFVVWEVTNRGGVKVVGRSDDRMKRDVGDIYRVALFSIANREILVVSRTN